MNPLKKKSPAKPSAGKQKRKSRAELDAEGRERKRQKKRRGHSAGSRHNSDDGNKRKVVKQEQDPRVGSKVPVPLIVGEKAPTMKPAVKPVVEQQKPRLSPQEELEMLEHDERLDDLLARLEQGEKLSQEDNAYVDNTLDRIDTLMEALGIELEEEDNEEEPQEDIMQLLKGK
ncbi:MULTISPECIES: Der GTPase-activating protein YihI [Xenorhabdus]|uniref:Der GTPase-activating protein YihI n=1 Tax=Xenorhabdus TaxID=626 RepID=UPI00064B360B|nr:MULTISPECIES: Der GTPase-activating protein YihI [Xenorhabdus]KLU17296.1 GTPase activator [Xenorhabdus griffiniae]KOP33140.1 GTPase activator [Xenorhabdus sp. GDc328]WFQ79049.1 Der GTPase-activating protein YihI [Xenorhabdus sp. SF857]